MSILVDKLYPFLKKYKGNGKLSKDETKSIIDNVKALFIYKASSVFLGGIDNLIISSQIGVICVAIYSNYTLIINSLTNVINMFTTSITASIGNFMATEKEVGQKKLFERVVFINFLLFGFSSVCLYTLLNPFIEIYSGKDMLLSSYAVILIVLNFFIMGMMSPIWTFRTTMGLFIYGRWRPVISAAINFVLSMVFAQFWGIEGVLIATAISRITTNLWYDPYIVYKKGWNMSPISYYIMFMKYSGVVIAIAVGISILSNIIYFESSIWGFMLRLLFVVILTTLMFAIVVFCNPDKEYFRDIVYRLFLKVRTKS